MQRLMSVVGTIAILVCIILFVIDLFIDKELLNYWLPLLLINQFTLGYRYYFKEDRKMSGIFMMGTIAVVFIISAIILVT